MTNHTPQYTTVTPVRKLAHNPRTVDVSDAEILVEIESACDDVDSITHRLTNPFTMTESYAELIERNARRIAAANVIENFDTYNNIEVSWAKGEFLRARAEKELNDWLGTQTTSNLDESSVVSVSTYETYDAAKDEGQLEPPINRSTNYTIGGLQDEVKEVDYRKIGDFDN